MSSPENIDLYSNQIFMVRSFVIVQIAYFWHYLEIEKFIVLHNKYKRRKEKEKEGCVNCLAEKMVLYLQQYWEWISTQHFTKFTIFRIQDPY